ncbi:hypothetical protein C1646_772686 [Rhizophagus diaphanus]|nr:hypothetical protein C1646_772686 [Rhizophagus diaphanus] [Rhizophagus sp. MUCL 43196]
MRMQKKRAWKVLSEFINYKAFSSTVVKNFIEELKLEDERRACLTTLSRKITSINALQLLEEQRMAKVLIEDMRNEDVRGSTSAIDDHTKQKPDKSHYPDNNETLAKKTRVEIESQNTTIYGGRLKPLTPVESEEIKNRDAEDLIKFLKRRVLHLNEKHFEILRDREITGCDFFKMNKEDFKECGFEIGPSMRLVNVAKELNNQKSELCEELLNEPREELLNELRKKLCEEFRKLCDILRKKLKDRQPCSKIS